MFLREELDRNHFEEIQEFWDWNLRQAPDEPGQNRFWDDSVKSFEGLELYFSLRSKGWEV